MPIMRIAATYALNGLMDRDTAWETPMTGEEMNNLVPASSTSPSGNGWAYWDQAEAYVVSGMKSRLFPDETTEVSKASDLKRLGVSKLRVILHDESGNTNSFSLI